MNIVVGLGNYGDRYENTRHNAGFMVLDNLRQVLQCPEFSMNKKLFSEVCKTEQTIFLKPQTFMNESGKAVRAVIEYYKDKVVSKNTPGYQNLFVIHDDLDLPLGEYKIQFGTGPKVHNGLLSLYQHLGTKNFWHIRIGIDTREGDRTIAPQVYVLQKFTPDEKEKMNQVIYSLVKELSIRIQQ